MDDESGVDLESKSYIYMELESTSNFKDIDIDKMLEHTSMDDFMRGLYVTGIEKSRTLKSSSAGDQTKQVMAALMTGQGLDKLTEEQEEHELNFGDEKQEQQRTDEDFLRMQAMENLRTRRLRLKSSAIFNAKEVALKNLKQKQASLNLNEEDLQAGLDG